MSRTSLVHYIAPSSISITPNANGSENDIAVYVARGTKIKVLSPKVGIGYNESSFRQWAFSGRNRRLADSALPYTIYARLSKNNQKNGYLVFAPKRKVGDDWADKYAYVTRDGLANVTDSIVSEDYWYIRLGEVSLPEDGKRTVTFDSGVLGTDQYNTEWIENADALPLRIELGCTIDDEDAGQTPYVHWDKSLLLTALLMKGWDSVSSDRFRHWEISRNTGDPVGDAKWPSAARQAEFRKTGTITLNHLRGDDDDFNGAMSAVFTITAWGMPEASEEGNTPQEYVVIASESITILAESVEKYELALSTAVVSYSPQSDEYSPKEGVLVRIRAIDQRGDVMEISVAQMKRERLTVSIAPVDSDVWSPLTFGGGDTEVAEATIGTAAFLGQKSMNVQLTRPVGALSTEGTEAVAELARTTIAFVRDGDDSREREWIFLRSKTAITFSEDVASGHPLPVLISGGEVDPKGAASGNDTNKNQDGWVPQGWWDEQQGVDSEWCYEYGAFRDFRRDDPASGAAAAGPGHWGDFSTPRIWNHFGTDGGKPVSRYQWSQDAKKPPHYYADRQDPGPDWHVDVPNRPEGQGWYLWVISSIKNHDGTYGPWGDPIRMTGDEGAPGTKTQRAYFKSDSDVPPERPEGEVTSDSTLPGAWRRVALSADEYNCYVYICERISEDNGETWREWGNVVLFCYRPNRSQLEKMILEYGSKHFARKDIDDEIKSLWTFKKDNGKRRGIQTEEYNSTNNENNINGKGFELVQITDENGETLSRLEVDELLVRLRALISELRSKDFQHGLTMGNGWRIRTDENGRSEMEIDKLMVRMKAVFAMLEIRKVSHTGGDFTFSAAGSEIIRTERRLNGWRCYLMADDGSTRTMNDWKPGDMALSKTFNIKEGVYENVSNRYYFRLVTTVGSEVLEDGRTYNYVDLSDVRGLVELNIDGQLHRCIGYDMSVDNDTPNSGDVIVQRGSQTDPDRQHLFDISLSDGALVFYANVNDFDTASHAVMRLDPRGSFFMSDRMEIRSYAGGDSRPIVCFRGEWVSGTIYGRYDAVYCEGRQYLCIIPKGSTTSSRPDTTPTEWMVYVEKGTDGLVMTILTDTGNIIRNGQGKVQLLASLMSGAKNVTQDYPQACFSWTRNSGNAEWDEQWNIRHRAVGHTIEVSAEDVFRKAVFECVLNE